MQGPENRNPYGSNGPLPPPHYTPGPHPGNPVNGTLILILGILGVTVCGICGPFAWVMGNNALRLLNSGWDDPSQRQIVTIGRILGIIGTVLLVLGLMWMFFVVGLSIFGFSQRPVAPITPPFRSFPS